MTILSNPRIKGDFLVCDNEDIDLLRIPKGCILSKSILNNYEIDVFNKDGRVNLIAKNIVSGKKVILIPEYHVVEKIKYKERDIDIAYRTVSDKSEISLGNSIVECNHYLKASSKGMMIIAEIISDDDHKFLVDKLYKQSSTSIFEQMLCKSSKIIGCAVIDRLTYGSPKGRLSIAKELGVERYLESGLDDSGNKLHRNDILNLLKVSWASRFAVLSMYQGIGIGVSLATHLGVVASEKMIPEANYIEVFTTHSKEKAKDILKSKSGSFLLRAKYNIHDELLLSKPFYNNDEGKFETHKKLYFYKKVGK